MLPTKEQKPPGRAADNGSQKVCTYYFSSGKSPIHTISYVWPERLLDVWGLNFEIDGIDAGFDIKATYDAAAQKFPPRST